MELFYGCQRNTTELVLKENSPSLVYLPDGPSAVFVIFFHFLLCFKITIFFVILEEQSSYGLILLM